MRLKLISCEVFAREIAALLLEEGPHQITLELFSKGLHETGPKFMSAHLQQAIDKASAACFDAVLLGYGLCSYGTVGLKARSIPLVLPRAHDCITLLLGNRERYQRYFEEHPGTYFRSTGWIERRRNPARLRDISIAERNGLNASPADLKRRHGEEAGEYLGTLLCHQKKHYNQLTFIKMGVEPDDRFERQCKAEAALEGWKYERVQGELGLLRKFLNGDWAAENFLVVAPGYEIRPSYDGSIVKARPVVKEFVVP